MSSGSNVVVNFLGDASKLDKTINGVDSKLGKLGGFATKAAKVAGAAAITATATSVAAFADFDANMREVYTLMPGMSKKSMGKMEDDVLSLSREFGVLPNDVIPALYDSLSAGVPKDNVFDFLETSQKFAKAGATDVSTAVDGLTTVVNAFGMEAGEAGTAADVLFTAVKQGKTTVPELSASMFQVAPVAAAMGVGIKDVAAGFASLTAQGVPTAQAATQMKAAFAELGKQGTKADKAFRDITGKGFPDFIKSGGTVQEALNAMAEGAADSGISVVDMFGSIEAGQAVLGLTGEQAGRFSDNLAAMGDSSGAVDEAFETMNQGLKQTWNKIKAFVVTKSIELGRAIAPYLEQGIDMAVAVFGRLSDWWNENSADIIAQVQNLGDMIGDAFEAMRPAFDTLIVIFQNVASFMGDNLTPVLTALGVVIGSIVVGAVWALVAAVAALFSPVVLIIGGLALLAAGIVWAYNRFEFLQVAVAAVISFFTGTVMPIFSQVASYIATQFGNLVGWVKQHWGAIQEAISHIVNVIKGIISAWVSVVTGLWNAWGDDLLRIAKTIWDYIRETIENAIKVVQGIIQTVLAVINGDWGAAWDGIKQIAAGIWDQIHNIISTAINLVKSTIGGVLSTLDALWRTAWDALKSAVSTAWNGIKTAVSNGINGVVDFVKTLPRRIVDALAGLARLLVQKGKDLMRGLIDGIKSMAGSVADAVANAVPGGGVVKGLVGSIPGLATGATNFAGGLAVVGEEGPELVNLPRGSDVFTHSKSKDMVAGAGGGDGLTRADLLELAEMLIDGLGEKMGETADRSARSAVQQMRAAGAR